MLKVGSDKNISDKVAFQALVAVSHIGFSIGTTALLAMLRSNLLGTVDSMLICCLSDEIIIPFLNVLWSRTIGNSNRNHEPYMG
jgi:hypothetical protein